MKSIPWHEPEVIDAGARRIDPDKVATTAIRDLTVHGVHISSRYNKADELEIMSRMVAAIDPRNRHFVKSIWCDSKATACYTIVFRPTPKPVAEEVLDQIEDASGGHNGIWVEGCDANNRDPDWGEVFE